MKFYEIAPASRQYHGSTPLTYCSEQSLEIGQIVVVKIRQLTAIGFVTSEVSKPDFKTTKITDSLPSTLPPQHVELFKWLNNYYPSPLGITVQHFLPMPKPQDYATDISHGDKLTPITSNLPQLTPEQVNAVKSIQKSDGTTLLHGDTGTGKTRVYIEAALDAISKGKSVLVLVPEISLSPQTVKSFKDNIAAPVHITHSGLTAAQRRKTWQNIIATKIPQIVIGPRSAVFSPLRNIGLIIMDEFHEPAYKQDQSPHYQTIRVAAKLSQLSNAKLVLGSATPPISEYYIAEQRNIPIVRMKQKAASNDTFGIDTKIVNIKDSSERTKHPLITQSLIKAVKVSLQQGEQVLLFLNKRGSARVVLCQNCGWHALCDRCDLPYTYHSDSHQLQCHTCGKKRITPSVCPECSSHEIIFKSPGTKAIVESIQNIFPNANIARFDKDNKKAEKLETRHEEIVRGDIDILIGTQLLAKGHDLPRLSTVGILLAENELQFPDYTSSERSYQLMHQLIGRVDRGHRNGTVIVQTYDPSNIAVQSATKNYPWRDFYKNQLEERNKFEFPPFYYLMKIEITRARPQTVASSCDQIIKFLKESGEPIKILDPTPSFTEKRNNTWTWQIIVKAKDRNALTRLATKIPVKCIINLDPNNLL